MESRITIGVKLMERFTDVRGSTFRQGEAATVRHEIGRARLLNESTTVRVMRMGLQNSQDSPDKIEDITHQLD